MFLTPDTVACQQQQPYCSVNQVYLNGFLAEAPEGDANPNVGALGSGFQLGVEFRFTALFGVWKDCNNDGVIGLGENGLMEYRSEVLAQWPGVGNSICPPTRTPIVPATGLPPVGWMPSHNDGQWVREFLPFANDPIIQTASGPVERNPWDLPILGTGTHVWGDFGLPGPLPIGNPGCGITPLPYGTMRSAGGALSYVDCFDGFGVTHRFSALADSNPTLAPYSFSDSPNDPSRSHSAANVQNPWGNEGDRSDVQVWDCGQPTTSVTAPPDPTGHAYGSSRPHVANVSRPMLPPSPPSPSGSAAGTMNATGSGFDQCSRSQAAHDDFFGSAGGLAVAETFALIGSGQAHTGQDLAALPYAFEAAPRATTSQLVYKQGPSDNLGPSSDARPATPFAAVLGKSTPSDFGVDATGLESGWTAATLANPNGGLTTNEGVWQGGANWVLGPATGVGYVTYYASIDPQMISAYALSLPGTPFNGGALTTGTYGTEACGGSTTGDHNGWDCDATHWTGGGAKVGDVYELRDIDCYDQSVSALRSSGISAGTKDGAQCSTP